MTHPSLMEAALAIDELVQVIREAELKGAPRKPLMERDLDNDYWWSDLMNEKDAARRMMDKKNKAARARAKQATKSKGKDTIGKR